MMTRRTFAALFLLFVVLSNGFVELYVAALAAERAGIRLLPAWLRIESSLCVPTFYQNNALTICQCPRSAALPPPIEGVPIAKARWGKEIPLSSLTFPVPDSLSFKFLCDSLVLTTSAPVLEFVSRWYRLDPLHASDLLTT
jgi:hypothetical protein